MKKTITAVTLAGVMLIGAMAVMPTASAQTGKPIFTFTISGAPSSPVTPIEDTVQLSVDYTYTLKLSAQNVASLQGTATVTVQTVCSPNFVTISGSTTDIIPLSAGNAAGTAVDYTGKIPVQITVLRTAPALDPISCKITGSVGSVFDNGLPATDPYEQTVQIKPDYYSLLEAKSGIKLQRGGPQKQIPFDIELTNFGNGQTKVQFEIRERPEQGNWQGLIPDELILDAPGGNKQTNTATFTVATPYKNGWNNEEGAFTLAMKPEYVFNPDKKGSEVSVTLLARVRGVYVPSLEPLVMVGAVIGTALVARMRRDEE